MWNYNYDYLCHHGILGQKWGVRRFQNYDGTLTQAGKERYGKLKTYTKIRGKMIDDYIMQKNSKFYRYTTNLSEKFNTRMYVSQTENSSDYEELAYNGRDKAYLVEYELKKDAKMAGRETIKKVLKDINAPFEIDWGYVNADYNADFMNKNSELRANFIKELKKQGYDGLIDPVDSDIGIGFDETATIFINDVLKIKNIKEGNL